MAILGKRKVVFRKDLIQSSNGIKFSKDLVMLLIVIAVSSTTLFAASESNQKSIFSVETQVGYSINGSTNEINDTSTPPVVINRVESTQQAISLGEKLTLHTGFLFDLTASASYNYVFSKEDVAHGDVMGTAFTSTTDAESEKFQHYANFFVGLEKSFNITDNVAASLAIGPNFICLFENDDSNSSYYVYGIEGNLNLSYRINPKMKLSCGIHASFDPIWGGDFIDNQETVEEVTEIDLSNYAYAITPTIGFSYSL